MQRRVVYCLFLIILFAANPAHSTSYQQGMNAVLARDYVKALTIWTPLAINGDATPQFQLGWLYEQGYGAEKNYQTALEWYNRAAEQGYPYAQSAIGRMFRDGLGVAKDFRRARMWFSIAAASSDPDANQLKIQISDQMATEDILKADELARICIRNKFKGC